MGGMTMNKKIILLAVSLVGSQAWAENVSVPNVFTDGTTASAGEVNANFTAVENAVNDNDGRISNNATNILTNTTNVSTNVNSIQNNATAIGVNAAAVNTNASGITTNASDINTNSTNVGINAADVTSNVTDIQTNVTDIQSNATAISNLVIPKSTSVFFNDSRVGTFLAFNGHSLPIARTNAVIGLLDTGFIFVTDETSNLISYITYFLTSDCSGQAYVETTRVSRLIFESGLFYKAVGDDPAGARYTLPRAITETVTYNSRYSPFGGTGTCTFDIGQQQGVKAFANDISVTGVSVTDFTGPVRIGY